MTGNIAGYAHIASNPDRPAVTQNLLLSLLDQQALSRLAPHLTLVELELGAVICESGQLLNFVYFPTDSIVSLLNVLESGASAEIAMVGNEGMVGVSLILGVDHTPSRAVVQSSGFAYKLSARAMLDEFNRHESALLLFLRYVQSLMIQSAQTAVCNRHHSVDQQLCRWLLLSHDRLKGGGLNMTQELIANMLGVRREGVTEAAGKLQKLGAIAYRRGKIKILDRSKLESLACECYRVVKMETDRLFALKKQ